MTRDRRVEPHTHLEGSVTPARLILLAEKYGQFLPDDPVGRSEVMQWLFFQVGHMGPMMGQAMSFQRIAAPNGHAGIRPFDAGHATPVACLFTPSIGQSIRDFSRFSDRRPRDHELSQNANGAFSICKYGRHLLTAV